MLPLTWRRIAAGAGLGLLAGAVGFVVTTNAEAPAEVWFDDYELTFCR